MLQSEATVFVVDDDTELCNAIRWLLQSVNLKVEIYANGQAYLQHYNPKAHGCLLIDIRMPLMGGFELLTELNKRNNRLPILFITGHGDVPMAVRAMQEGAVDFILKPFNDELLLEKIQKAIASDKKRQELGEPLVDPKLLSKLTPREHEVMKNIAGGKLNKQISQELNISDSTVEFHRANLMRKLKAKTAAELVRIYMLCSKA